MANDPRAAEAALRPAVESLQRMGEQGMMSTAVAMLARPSTGRAATTRRCSRRSPAKSATAADDVASQMAWRGVRAKILARRGDHREAERLAREGVAFGDETDLLNMSGDAHMDLAVVLAAPARSDEATEELGPSVDLYERKATWSRRAAEDDARRAERNAGVRS